MSRVCFTASILGDSTPNDFRAPMASNGKRTAPPESSNGWSSPGENTAITRGAPPGSSPKNWNRASRRYPPPRALRDAATGTLVPVEADAGKLRFVARDVPPLGYRTYAFAGQAARAKSQLGSDEKLRVIENEFFRVTLDPARGGIASLLDKASGRELADTGDAAFGQYVHERFSAADMVRWVKTYTKPTSSAIWGDFGKPNMPPEGEQPHSAASPRNLTLRIARGAGSVTAVMEAGASRRSEERRVGKECR